MMDHHKLRSAVFEKTGIKIDTTDPIFALVALNESVLEEMFQRHLHLLQTSHGISSTDTIVRPPVRTTMHDNWEQDEVPHSATSTSQASNPQQATPTEPAPPPNAPHTPRPSNGQVPVLNQRILAFAAALGLACALLVVGVQTLLQPGLSMEQKAQLQQAEKLRKALDKLDPKLKAQLPAELKQLN